MQIDPVVTQITGIAIMAIAVLYYRRYKSKESRFALFGTVAPMFGIGGTFYKLALVCWLMSKL
jgi:hypothetical protein